jgi:hypothetical protein
MSRRLDAVERASEPPFRIVVLPDGASRPEAPKGGPVTVYMHESDMNL